MHFCAFAARLLVVACFSPAAWALVLTSNSTADGRLSGLPACFDKVLKKSALLPGARPSGSGCPAIFSWYNLEEDIRLKSCYNKYLSDEEFEKFMALGEDSQHAGPLYLARELPKHPCVTKDASKADYFLVPPFLPQWNRNFDNRDKECQYEVLRFVKNTKEYQDSKRVGHDKFVVLNWWKGREQSIANAFPNAIYVGKDCSSNPCVEPFSAWPYFDNTPGAFEPKAHPVQRDPVQRDILAVGVWGVRKGASQQRASLQAALLASNDSVHKVPGIERDHGASIFNLYRQSKFCLNPRGDSLSRRSLSTCILAGSIPVLIVDSLNKPFEHILNYDAFSIELPQSTPGDKVLEKLRRISAKDIDQLLKNTECIQQAFLYDSRTSTSAVAPGSMLDFLLADIARVGELEQRRT